MSTLGDAKVNSNRSTVNFHSMSICFCFFCIAAVTVLNEAKSSRLVAVVVVDNGYVLNLAVAGKHIVKVTFLCVH